MTKNDCIFCKIIEGKIPSSKIFENDHVIGFKDLHPQAPVHYLFVHKEHSKDINDLMTLNPSSVTDIFLAIKLVTIERKIDQLGFRVVTNSGSHGGQSVFHTHFHLLAGAPLGGFGESTQLN